MQSLRYSESKQWRGRWGISICSRASELLHNVFPMRHDGLVFTRPLLSNYPVFLQNKTRLPGHQRSSAGLVGQVRPVLFENADKHWRRISISLGWFRLDCKKKSGCIQNMLLNPTNFLMLNEQCSFNKDLDRPTTFWIATSIVTFF